MTVYGRPLPLAADLSASNLAGDAFLRSKMEPGTGFVDLALLCSFKRLKALCCGDMQLVIQALLLAQERFELVLLPHPSSLWQPVESARVRTQEAAAAMMHGTTP